MKKRVRMKAPYRLRPVIIPLGVEILHERERAQGEIFHPAYRKGDAFLREHLQPASGRYHIDPRKVLIEVPEHRHRFRHFLNLIDEQQGPLVTVLGDVMLETYVLPKLIGKTHKIIAEFIVIMWVIFAQMIIIR